MVRPCYRLYKADRDALYRGRVNPITKFTTSGVVIYGQKTLQVAETNRINVRRLLISLRRFGGDTCKGFVFEQNTNATRIKLKNILNPYMESVKNKQGLYAYQVVVDDTNNTSDVIDRNELAVTIKIAPTRTIEFVLLTFVISPTGVSF
jgi:phage tail sheath protein FI